MKIVMSILSVLLLMPLTVLRAEDLSPASFKPDERWCVLGDSITHGGFYHKYVELFYMTRFPSQPLQVVNCGISGDTATGARRRLQWDCLAAKPTVVTIMLGMNDVGRYLYEQGAKYPDIEAKRKERLTTCEKEIRGLTQVLLDAGVKVILIQPSIFDDTADVPTPNNPGLGAALAGLGRSVQAIAAEYKVATVDFSTPMAAINAREQKHDPKFSIVGIGRVHPGAPGHLVMAHAFLQAQHMPGVVARIAIDADANKAGESQNCQVSDLKASGKEVSFTCIEKSLPFPVSEDAKPALSFVQFTEHLNEELLVVHGLPAGDYELNIDGIKICSAGSADWAKGVNLATQTGSPQYQQSLAVQAAMKKKWEAEDKLRTIAACEHGAWPDATHPVDLATMRPKLDARLAKLHGTSYEAYIGSQHKQYLEVKPREADLRREVESTVQAARAAAQPKAHRFVLRAM